MRVSKQEQELQRVKQWTKRLDNLLLKAMEVLQSGDKWSFTPEGNMVTVYPHPVIDIRELRINEVKYSQNKNYVFPKLLQDRQNSVNEIGE